MESLCIESHRVLQNNKADECWGRVEFYTKFQACCLGFVDSVYLCRSHYLQKSRKEKRCCYPFSGPCSKNLVTCPSRLSLVFKHLNVLWKETDFQCICNVHLKEADCHEIIAKHPEYEPPSTRKVCYVSYLNTINTKKTLVSLLRKLMNEQLQRHHDEHTEDSKITKLEEENERLIRALSEQKETNENLKKKASMLEEKNSAIQEKLQGIRMRLISHANNVQLI